MSKSSKLEKTISVVDTILTILVEIGSIHFKVFFPHPYYHTFCSHKSRNTLYSSLSRLKKKGFIKYNENHNTFTLTSRGEEKALFSSIRLHILLFLKEKANLKQDKKKWDGYWRVVVFDIPNKFYGMRDLLRDLLKSIGFRKLQNSVWVFPYKAPEYLNETLNDNRIKKYVRFLLVKEIYYDWDIRKLFFKK